MRGLTHTEQGSGGKDGFCSSPSFSMYPGRPFSTPMDKEPLSPYSPIQSSGYDSPLKMAGLPHMPHITFTENPPHPDGRLRCESDKDRGSPIPRRKQVNKLKYCSHLRCYVILTAKSVPYWFLWCRNARLFQGKANEKVRGVDGRSAGFKQAWLSR